MAKKKSEMEKAPWKIFRYIGRRFTDELFDKFVELDETFNDNDERKPGSWKVGRGRDSFVIGATYRVRCTDGYTIWLGSAEIIDDAPEPTDADLTAWAMLDQDARNSKQRENATKRQEKKARDAFGWVIDGLQPIYNKLGHWDRLAMVRVLGEELRKGARL